MAGLLDRPRYSLWPAEDEINEGAEKMQKQNHKHPGDFFTIAQSGVCSSMNEHPNPKNE
jgi:hypothetical protein